MDMIPRADHDAAVLEARADATLAERERIGTILQTDAAKARPAAALQLALTDATPATAAAVLATIKPEATQPTMAIGLRAQDAPGGLVTSAMIEGGPSASIDQQHVPSTDFERGKAIARKLAKGA